MDFNLEHKRPPDFECLPAYFLLLFYSMVYVAAWQIKIASDFYKLYIAIRLRPNGFFGIDGTGERVSGVEEDISKFHHVS